MGMTAVCICLIKGIMVGPAGVGVRRAAGGRTGAGPVITLGAAWAVAAREKARAATVKAKRLRRRHRDSQGRDVGNEREGEERAEKKKNKRRSLVHALVTQKCQSTPTKCKTASPSPM